MPLKTDLPSSLFQGIPWGKDSNPIWLSSSLLFMRNLNHARFPAKLKEKEALLIRNTLSETLQTSLKLQNPLSSFPLENLSALDRDFLAEHFLCNESLQPVAPGQAFLIDASGTFLAQLNLKDHLQLEVVANEPSFDALWAKLVKMEAEINQKHAFAFSSKFGYLTSLPAECGTGLIARCYLHLPALIHTEQFSSIFETQKEELVTVANLGGSQEEFIGDLVVLSNRYTLGVSEENILRSLQSTAMKLMASEKAIRAHLKATQDPSLKDQISRAFGLLLHSYQLQTPEALNALSLLKLGLDLDWITGITHEKINALFFQCRRAHLAFCLQEMLHDPAESARKRASWIHEALQGTALKS